MRSRLVVRTFRFDGHKLVSLDNVGRQRVTVYTTSVEADGFLAAARLGRGPVTEEHRLLTVIDVIPRRAFITFAIAAERSQPRQIAGRLRVELDVWTQTRVHHEMRAEIDRER